jgi:hypothetical protein
MHPLSPKARSFRMRVKRIIGDTSVVLIQKDDIPETEHDKLIGLLGLTKVRRQLFLMKFS